MKKFYAVLLALVCTLSMSAAIQSKLGIYMYSDVEDAIHENLEEAVLIGVGTESTWATPSLHSFAGVGINTHNYGVYAVYGGNNYSEVYASESSMKNIPLVVVTSREAAANQKYSFFFDWDYDSENTGTVTITDLRPKAPLTAPHTITLTKEGEYAFELGEEDAFVAGSNCVIADRFVINYDPAAFVTSVTTNDYGWATFSYDQDLVPVNSAIQTLYKGAINGDVLALDPVDYVKAGEGVLVYGTPNTIYNFAAGNGAADFTGNDLKATSTYSTSMQNVFVLKGDAFLEYVGTNALALNKAYIQLPAAGPNNAPKRITMRFNGTTAVDNVEAEFVKAEKFVENGQIYIRRGNEVFNLQGQKVNF